MKKILVSAILILLFGWAVYQALWAEQAQPGTTSPVSDVRSNESAGEDAPTDGQGDQSDITVGIRVGDLAPDFTLQTIEGEEAALSDMKGKKVIITFWATWCPNCRAEMPAKTRFYNDFQDEVEILAVNLTESELSLANVEQFVEDQEINFPVLLDQKSDVAGLFQALSVPTSYLLDSEGVIQYKVVGPMSYDSMKNALDTMK